MSGPFDDASTPGGDRFGYAGSRTEALAAGRLHDVSALAREAGFKWDLAFARDAWDDCVRWTAEDSRKQVFQSERVRLIDVLRVCAYAIRLENPDRARMNFELARIPRDGESTRARRVTLQIAAHLGDEGEPVLTILLPPATSRA